MAPRLDPFRESHALRYGLEVVARDAATNDVTSVLCLFCRHYGREERPGKKRKTTPNFKYFHAFRSDLYNQHLRSQHPTLWEKYKCSKDDVKLLFFPKDLTRPEPDKQKLSDKKDVVEAAVAAKSSEVEKFCWFLIPKRIVDLVVPSALLGGDRRWQPPNFRACEVVDLTRQEAEGVQDGVTQGQETDREEYYQVALFVRMELDVALDALAAGLSPRQASLYLAALARRTIGAGAASPAFPLLTTETIREMARLVMSESMKLTGQLLARSWCFGLVLREVTAAPALPRADYLDVRVVVYAQGKLRDIHVIALPLFERHAALGLARAIETVVDAVFPPWRTRVLGITQDGCAGSGMGAEQAVSADQPVSALSPLPTHRSSEVLSYLESSIKASPPATPKRALYRTWGAYHQVSLALESFYDSLLGGRFLPVMRSLTAYIRQNPELLRVMGHPPSVMVGKRDEASTLNASIDLTVSAEGLAVGIDAQLITDKRVRLRKYLEQNSAPAAVPSSPSSSATGASTPIDDVWWIAFFVVHWVAARANEAFENLLLRRVSRTRQSQVITELATELMKTFNVKLDQQPEGQELPYFSRQGKFSILKSSVHDFLCDQGIFVTNVVNRVNPTELNAVLESLATCLVNLTESLTDLGTSPTESETSSEVPTLPPTLPHDFARLNGREFTTILQHHAGLLHAFYSDEELDALEQEYQALHRSATRDSNLKSALADCYEESPFAESWKLTKDQFPLLQAFAGGLASAYNGRDAGSSNSMVGLSVRSSKEEVASDNALRHGVTDFVLESSLHAQQFDELSELCRDLVKPSQPSETTDP